MSNYANLLEEASAIICRAKVYDPRRMVNANLYILAANVMEELVEALVTVSNQNRNLRADLELTKRDYEANLEELLKAAEAIKALSETICVEVNGLRYIVDPRLKEPVVGVYDPELAEVLE